jgi:hypothetical protein
VQDTRELHLPTEGELAAASDSVVPILCTGSIWRTITAITPRPHDWLYIATIMSSRGFGPRFVLSAGL